MSLTLASKASGPPPTPVPQLQLGHSHSTLPMQGREASLGCWVLTGTQVWVKSKTSPILHMGRLRLREAKFLCQNLTGRIQSNSRAGS